MIRFVFFLLLLAALLYGLFWAIDRRSSGGPSSGPSRPVPRGPVGPDDDEAFLRGLDRGNPPRPPATNPDPRPAPPPSQEHHDQPE